MSKALNSIALLLGFCITSNVLAQEEILIGYIGDTNSEARRGVELGLQEANIQGKISGHSFRILDNPTPSANSCPGQSQSSRIEEGCFRIEGFCNRVIRNSYL